MNPFSKDEGALAHWLEDCLEDQKSDALPNPTDQTLEAVGEQLQMHHLLWVAGRSPTRDEAFIQRVMGALASEEHKRLPFAKPGGGHGPGWRLGQGAGWVAAAALVLLCVAADLLGNRRGAWLVASHGPVVWRADRDGGGQGWGGKLAGGGVLSSDVLGAMARVELGDGSKVTVGGPFFLRLPGEAGGRLQLTQGSLSAMVKPQRQDKPLEIKTPVALLTVLGTELLVDCRGLETRLRVDAGSVRMGLLEGKGGRDIDPTLEAEVVGGETGRPEVQVRARRAAESGWRLETVRQAEFGVWHPSKGGRGGGLEGLKGRWPGGKSGDWGRLCVMNLTAEGRGPVLLEKGGFLSLTGRFPAGAEVEVGLMTRKTRGELTGLYHGKVVVDAGLPGEKAHLVIDHQDLKADWGGAPGNPEDLEATLLLVGVHDPEVEFLLERVAIEPGRVRAQLPHEPRRKFEILP